MFIIEYKIKGTRIQWNCEHYFESKNQAEQYLSDNQFTKTGLYYEKDYNNWFPKTLATVTMLKKFSG